VPALVPPLTTPHQSTPSAAQLMPQQELHRDTSEADATYAAKRRRYLLFNKFVLDLYKKHFELDKNSKHWKDYNDAQNIIFSKYHHNKEALEWEGKMRVYSLRQVKVNTLSAQLKADISPTHNINHGQPKDGGGDRGGGGGNFGATNLVQDELVDDDSADMEQEGFYTAASWNPPAPNQHVRFSQEIASICRALYLCNIPHHIDHGRWYKDNTRFFNHAYGEMGIHSEVDGKAKDHQHQ